MWVSLKALLCDLCSALCWRTSQMLRTIEIGTCMAVQGLVVRHLDDGRITIRIADRLYTGFPVGHTMAKAA